MQAIRTKYFGPTERKPSRLQAKCDAGAVWVSYNHNLDADGNHKAACEALRAKLKWTTDNNYKPMTGGGFEDACYWVFPTAWMVTGDGK